MLDCFIIFILQFTFQLSRTWGQRAVSKNSVISTVFANMTLQFVGLFAFAFGINAVINENWYSVASYLIGGFFGILVSFKMPILNEKNEKL